MNKTAALRDIIREAQTKRQSQAGLNRILRAFDNLGLTKDEACNTLFELGYPRTSPLFEAWLAKAK